MTATYQDIDVEFSHTDKLYFPEEGITKRDVLEYYERISGRLLPHLENRPVTLHRFPDGIDSDGFYQKQSPDYFPHWIETIEVEKREDGEIQQLVNCKDVRTLLYLVNQGTLTFHPWLSEKDDLEKPTRAVIDLDTEGEQNDLVKKSALRVMDALEDKKQAFELCTTGSSGYHVIIPLKAERTFDDIRKELQDFCKELAGDFPELLTVEHRKNKRQGRIYLDVARNAYAQTAVAPFCLRALPEAPVATPIDPDELSRNDMEPRRYTLKNIFRRLAQKG